jgi:hypothetical protein
MKYVNLIIILSTLLSCTNLSKNMVKKDEFVIRNGIYRNIKWKETLTLKRVSWYHELTLLFETIYGHIDKKSKFYHWFSIDEQKRIEKCDDVILSINYSLDTDRISHGMYDSIMRNANYEKIVVPNFTKALRMHPDYKRLSLTLYKTQVYCKKSKIKGPVYINFPNYSEIKL